jgi:tetratricopeptide (TPR) repeat protein
MPNSLPPQLSTLQQRAIELVKNASFGTEALDLNLEITRLAPDNEGAWTRLGRCYLEQRRFADAAGALATALEINPGNSIAKSLLSEVTKRRAMALPTAEAASGFTAQDFHALGHLAPVEAARALGLKMETLLMSLNEQRTALRIVEARNRAGQSGAKLFHRNSYHAGETGHLYAYHHGGRWEPQINIGLYSESPGAANCFRAGIGFNMAQDGRTAEPSTGQEQAVGFFELFQQQLQSKWRSHLVDWMGQTGGFIQFGARGPATDMLPDQAVDWLINCRNPVGVGWIFVGRWLFLDRADDAARLAEMRTLVATVEDTFAALHPIWLGTYRE